MADNTFYALVRQFIASPKFKSFAPASQRLWTHELKWACRLSNEGCLGNIATKDIKPALVQGYLDIWDDRPGKQAAALAAFKALDRWASVRDLLPRPITFGVQTGRPTGGHLPWTDMQVSAGEQHARADIARAITP